MTRSLLTKIIGIILVLPLLLLSCATKAWVGTKMEPALIGLQSTTAIGVMPFQIEYKTLTSATKPGKEIATEDRSPQWLLYNVKTVVPSPDAIRDYAVGQADLSLLARESVVEFMGSTKPFDITVSKGFDVKRYANADQESRRTISRTGFIKTLQTIGSVDPVNIALLAKDNNVDFILGGTIEIQGETGYITPRQAKDSPNASKNSPSPWKPGDAFAEFYVTYHFDVYSGETGLKVDSSDNYKIEYKDVTQTPYVRIPDVTVNEFLGIPDVASLSRYMKSSAFKDTVKTGLTSALADYTPLLRTYFQLVFEDVKEVKPQK